MKEVSWIFAGYSGLPRNYLRTKERKRRLRTKKIKPSAETRAGVARPVGSFVQRCVTRNYVELSSLHKSGSSSSYVDDYGGKVASVNIVAILYYYVCPCSAFDPVSKSSTSKDHAGLPCRGSVVKDADNLPLCFALVLYTDISPATHSVLVVVYQQELLVTAKLFFWLT